MAPLAVCLHRCSIPAWTIRFGCNVLSTRRTRSSHRSAPSLVAAAKRRTGCGSSFPKSRVSAIAAWRRIRDFVAAGGRGLSEPSGSWAAAQGVHPAGQRHRRAQHRRDHGASGRSEIPLVHDPVRPREPGQSGVQNRADQVFRERRGSRHHRAIAATRLTGSAAKLTRRRRSGSRAPRSPRGPRARAIRRCRLRAP